MKYKAEGVPLVVFGGKEYGTGSSRDWAAKGTFLLGVKAVIAESFERIHRSNLVGMGVLPLVFMNGQDRKSLNIKGDEQIDILGLEDLKPRQTLELVIRRADGTVDKAQVMQPDRYGRRGRVLQERRHPALRAARDGQGGLNRRLGLDDKEGPARAPSQFRALESAAGRGNMSPRRCPMASQAARDKVRRYRESMRRQGLRPLQIWVPDRHAPGFAEEARRQSRAIAESEQEKDDHGLRGGDLGRMAVTRGEVWTVSGGAYAR